MNSLNSALSGKAGTLVLGNASVINVVVAAGGRGEIEHTGCGEEIFEQSRKNSLFRCSDCQEIDSIINGGLEGI